MARKGSKSVGDAAGLSSIFILTDEGLDLLPSGVSVPSGFVGGYLDLHPLHSARRGVFQVSLAHDFTVLYMMRCLGLQADAV